MLKRLLSIVAFLTIVALVPSVSSQWEHTVYISVSGSDSESCMTSNSLRNPCVSLSFVIDKLKNSSRIIALGGTHIIYSVLTISAKQDISLEGVDGAGLLCVPSNETMGAGLSFVLLRNLRITGLTITNCGVLRESSMHNVTDGSILLFRTAVCLLNCTTVTIERITINHSTGIGLTVFDTNGNVSIEGSNFSNNSVPESERETYYGGGGMYIEMTYCSPGRIGRCDYQNNPYSNGSFYTITNCMFQDNQATTLKEKASSFVQQTWSHSQRLGRGGGLAITVKGSSSHNKFVLLLCQFINNSALFGGGVDIQLQDFVTFNTVNMISCFLLVNSAEEAGGGVRQGIIFYDCDCIYGNDFGYDIVSFYGNSASWGGGMSLTASRTRLIGYTPNFIAFSKCDWLENTAPVAAAINLSPGPWSSLSDGDLPHVTFSECSFGSNGNLYDASNEIAEGVIYSTGYDISFNMTSMFHFNKGTAILSNTGSINIMENTTIRFIYNSGLQGGALSLLGFAFIKVYPLSALYFFANSAVDEGGAIYAEFNNAVEFLYSQSCFLQYSDNAVPPDYWKVHFVFGDNVANLRGHSIYATSLLPCSKSIGSETPDIKKVFQWKSFNFSNDTRPLNIATDIATLEIGSAGENKSIKVIPGENYDLGIMACDELGNKVQTILKATTNSTKYPVHIDLAHEYISDGKIQISGPIGATFPVDIHTSGLRRIGRSINVTLISCPPGYVHLNDSNVCVCSADLSVTDYHLPGLTKCSPSFQAVLNKGFWAGCDVDGKLLTAECPMGYCSYDSVNATAFSVLLWNNCSAIEKQLCGPQNRKGVLCGKCADNYTVFIHSLRYLCGECKLGHLGWLFYILSELVPLTILFVVIVTFNIPLTTGAANGFILFAQVVDLLWVESFQQFNIPASVTHANSIYLFILGSFNFDFFKYNDSLSFCLWNGATVLDVLVFKYITSLYVIILLGVLLLVFKIPKCNRCLCYGRSRQRNWGVHGISAFLVLSYTQCAKVSFQILTQTNVYSYGDDVDRRVMFLMGQTEFMSKHHVVYAIPAIAVIVLLAVPPLVLTAYPLLWRLSGRSKGKTVHALDCQCSECVQTPHCASFRRWLRIGHYKPLIDSFQGCYKDDLRFFAGISFLYRLGIAAALALTTSVIKLYVCMEVMLILMLVILAVLQPYEKRFYNILDLLLFTDLAIVHGVSIFNYFCAECSQRDNDIASWFQIILIFLAMLYPICFVSMKTLACWSLKARRVINKMNDYLPIEQVQTDEETEGGFEYDRLPDRMG